MQHFVARDRARRIAWTIERQLQACRLAWQGDAVGMAAVRDDADQTLAAAAEDARASAREVLAGELRDRERGYMEIPFVVAMESVATWTSEAAALERRRREGRVPAEATRRLIEGHLVAALDRIRAFVAAYDAKQPALPPRPTDLGRVLARVTPAAEGDEADEAGGASSEAGTITSEPHALGDLLLAVASAAPEAGRTFAVTPSRPGRRLELAWGRAASAPADLPESVVRARDVLRFVHPVDVEARAEAAGAAPVGFAVALADPAGARLETVLAAAAGREARLDATARRAVRDLLAAPAGDAEGGPPPPERLVALLGLLRALDAALERHVGGSLAAPACRRAAREVPREATRKAPIRPAVLEALAAAYEDLPVHRLDGLLADVARGRAPARPSAAEAALACAVLGRERPLAGVRTEAVLDLGPLDEGDVDALVQDLCDVAGVRAALEGGQEVPPARLLRLERAAIGALGRLGRLAGASEAEA